jgi:acetoin utilization protein AcuB
LRDPLGTASAYSLRVSDEVKENGGAKARLARPIATVMRRHWISAPPRLTIYEAQLLMRLAGIRQLPVLSEQALVGVLGHGDLLRAALEQLLLHPAALARDLLTAVSVADVMDREPPTALPDESLVEVARRMVDARLGCLPVVERSGDALLMVGLVVESDLLRIAYAPASVAGS